MLPTAIGGVSDYRDRRWYAAASCDCALVPSPALTRGYPACCPKLTPLALVQVDCAGSMAIDDEMTDDFEYFGWGVLERCGVRLEQVHTLEPCAALALAVCCQNRPRWKSCHGWLSRRGPPGCWEDKQLVRMSWEDLEDQDPLSPRLARRATTPPAPRVRTD